ncbi:CinA family protein [Thalassobius vesicularis]|uniref:CinA family protein n=1 Tax=Thalassobius vesicularis TaxID=1294297 RepID=A0A4S3MA64_9RHOB|nr:CinA family protein [Thalassobius vesicularis]THD74976.1 CinA family protein [Thalassobius vesicularis]
MSATDLLTLYRTRGLRIATAESCTGGMVSAAITDIAGSSTVFERGFVTYTNEAKIQMLGVLPATLDAYGAVSEQVAQEMAEGALRHSAADVAVSITGIAGPGGSEFKPEGRVCFGLATRTGTHTETVEFGALGRANVRRESVQKAIALLISAANQ